MILVLLDFNNLLQNIIAQAETASPDTNSGIATLGT
jgi:hypothetical protein